MTTNSDFDRLARAWLQDGPTAMSDRGLEAALNEVHVTRQRRFGAARRAIPMNGNATRFAAAAMAGLLIIVAGGAFFLGRQGGVGDDPIATPSPTPTPIPLSSMADRAAGTYEVDGPFPIGGITLTLGPGWRLEDLTADFVNLSIPENANTPAWLTFNIVTEVYPDPCGAPGVPTSPPLGPTVDELVAALTNLVGYDASPVTDVTVGGLPARSFVLTDAVDSPCPTDELIGLVDGIHTNRPSTQRFIVMDVHGRRLLIGSIVLPAAASETEPSEYTATIDAAIDTIRFR